MPCSGIRRTGASPLKLASPARCLGIGSSTLPFSAAGVFNIERSVSIPHFSALRRQSTIVSSLESSLPASNNAPTASTHSSSSAQYRSHLCGELRGGHAGLAVRLCGWVQNVRVMGGSLVFLTLRDAYGLVQLTFRNENGAAPTTAESSSERSSIATSELAASTVDLVAVASSIRLESVIAVSGVVARRPAELVNPAMPTGEVEVLVSSLQLLGSVSESLPFTIGATTAALTSVPENTRLLYRPLDLRREIMQRNLRLRSAVTQSIRHCLHSACTPGFVEVETPSLFRSTPEGAREFLVPTRHPGKAYALTQSPQQHKQLLMVAGMDRYFQIARCYRDEAGRADRQPEFTQIDLEMSFSTAADVMSVTEGIVTSAFDTTRRISGAPSSSSTSSNGSSTSDLPVGLSHLPAIRPPLPSWAPLPSPFPRMTYAHAMLCYGSDKPDRRHGMMIADVTGALLTSASELTTAPGSPLQLALSSAGSSSSYLDSTRLSGDAWRPSADDTDLRPLLPTSYCVRAFVAPGLGAALTRKEWDALGVEIDRAVGKAPPPPTSSSSPPVFPSSVESDAAPASATSADASHEQQMLQQLHLSPALYRVKVEADLSWKGSPLIKAVPTAVQQRLSKALGAHSGDMVVLGIGSGGPLCKLMGTARLTCADVRKRKGLPLPSDAVQTTTAVAGNSARQKPHANSKNRQSDGNEPGTAGAGSAPAAAPVSHTPDLFWVTDFPLFEMAEEENPILKANAATAAAAGDNANAGPTAGTIDAAPSANGLRLPQLQSVHHPFTAPHEEDAPLLTSLLMAHGGKAPASLDAFVNNSACGTSASRGTGAGDEGSTTSDVTAPPPDQLLHRLLCLRGQHYDLVCNGVELGGGSIRIHDPGLQRFVLASVLRVSPAQLAGFGSLLTSLGMGAPPHGGLALGLDRLVATLAGPDCAASVRDVIAFPKSAQGNDLLTGAPAEPQPHQWRELHLAPLALVKD